MKKQTNIAGKKYHELGKVCGRNKIVVNKKCETSTLVNNNLDFNEFNISYEEFNELSDDTKYNHLKKFFNKINEFRKVKPRKDEKKERKVMVNKTISELCNKQIGNLDNEYNESSDVEENKVAL